jgi:hypothetical protein
MSNKRVLLFWIGKFIHNSLPCFSRNCCHIAAGGGALVGLRGGGLEARPWFTPEGAAADSRCLACLCWGESLLFSSLLSSPAVRFKLRLLYIRLRSSSGGALGASRRRMRSEYRPPPLLLLSESPSSSLEVVALVLGFEVFHWYLVVLGFWVGKTS